MATNFYTAGQSALGAYDPFRQMEAEHEHMVQRQRDEMMCQMEKLNAMMNPSAMQQIQAAPQYLPNPVLLLL